MKRCLLDKQSQCTFYHDANKSFKDPLTPNQTVRVRKERRWVPATVVRHTNNPHSYWVPLTNGYVVRRNRTQINTTREEGLQTSSRVVGPNRLSCRIVSSGQTGLSCRIVSSGQTGLSCRIVSSGQTGLSCRIVSLGQTGLSYRIVSLSQTGYRVGSCRVKPGYRIGSCRAKPDYRIGSYRAKPGYRVGSCRAKPGHCVESCRA